MRVIRFWAIKGRFAKNLIEFMADGLDFPACDSWRLTTSSSGGDVRNASKSELPAISRTIH